MTDFRSVTKTLTRFELRMAWRETRPALRKFLFMIGAIALGVGALTGITGAAAALDHAMARQARDLIAADVAVRLRSSPSPDEWQALDRLVALGAERTQVTETLSMASAGPGRAPVLVTVKAVEPEHYPYYGTVELEPVGRLAGVLDDSTTVATQEFLMRSGIHVGDTVAIGAASFRVAAVLRSEPDRIASGVELGPRALITRGGLERAALIQFGSRASESFLFRLPERGPTLETARGVLRTGLQRAIRIADYREPNPQLESGLARMTSFLSLVGLLSLLV